MKKFKNLMLMLALALFFVGAMGMTKASASGDVTAPSQGTETQDPETNTGDENETPTTGGETNETPSEDKIAEDYDYASEIIKVTCAKQVYYQVVKSAEPGKLKAANWIKAAYDKESVYCIDFSSVANGKDAFFALTTDNAAEEAAVVAKVDAVIKSVKVTLNYKTEEIKNGLADIITTLNVKGVEKEDDNAEGTAAGYFLQWKRGANGTWAAADEFGQLDWDMLKASNGTLYVAINGESGENQSATMFRMSKEAKVKIPKAAKAPTVKVDYVKGTLGLKNGMQVRVGADLDWMDVIAFDKESKGTDVFALATAGATTSKKVSTVAVADFVAAVKDVLKQTDDVKDGAEVTLTVRTAATNKKFPSMEGTVKLVLPKAAPAVPTQAVALTYTKADKENDIDAAYELDFSKLFTLPDSEKYSQYEYMFVADKADGTNLAKQKWTKLPEDGKVDLAKYIGKEYKYFKASDESKSSGVVKYEAIKAVYIRLAAVKATKEVTGVFASAYGVAEVAVTENVPVIEYTLTSDSENPAAATFKVGDAAATKAAKDATVEIVYTATEGKEIATVTYTVEGSDTPVTVTATDGKYTFKMPEGNVTVTITEKTAEAAQEPTA